VYHLKKSIYIKKCEINFSQKEKTLDYQTA
jgi:hypothetical protein